MFASFPLKNCFAQKVKRSSKWRQEAPNSLPTVMWLIATLQNCNKKLATENEVNSSLLIQQTLKGSGMKRYIIYFALFSPSCSLSTIY